jgi:hypothetical protein
MSLGTVMTGADPSTTFTEKLSLVDPKAFVAVQVTVVTPREKVEPDGGAQETVAPPVAVAGG